MKAPKPKHTPTPWRVVKSDRKASELGIYIERSRTPHAIVVSCLSLPDAEFIVRACNAHEALTATVARAVEMCDYALNRFNWGASALDAKAIGQLNEIPGELRRALALARGEAAK